jgi:hypothetical protein
MANYKSIVSTHSSPIFSGVAKFGIILADRLKCDFLSFSDFFANPSKFTGRILLSIKVLDLESAEIDHLRLFLSGSINHEDFSFDVFLHSFSQSDIECELLDRARSIFCGNAAIYADTFHWREKTQHLWCPSLLDRIERGTPSFDESKIVRILNFGMAHKLIYTRAAATFATLTRIGIEFEIFISSSFHEKAAFGDFKAVSSRIKSEFPTRVTFLGYLTDEGIWEISNHMDVMLCFFDPAARDNNTTLYSAIELGLPLISSTDQLSPDWLVDDETFLELSKLTREKFCKANLLRIAKNAYVQVSEKRSWELLATRFTS